MRRALLPLVLLAAGPVAAQDRASGEFLYFTFCATCHGAAAQGDGPTAGVLNREVPDLTGLAARNEGVFPTARVIARIEGTDPLAAHGNPMPLYGRIFDGAEPVLAVTPDGEVQTNAVVMDLLAWLQSVQR
jgi:mono/diheme cytochrome c family protein